MTKNDSNVKNAAFVKGESEALPLSEWMMLSSNLVRYTSTVIVGSITVEFCMAQAPCQVRGLVSTVIISACGIFRVLYIVLYHYIRIEWVFYIVRCVSVLVFFVIFVLLSKWYKLRKRDDVIPYHMFAEDQFESNYRQESKWHKNHEYLNHPPQTLKVNRQPQADKDCNDC